MGETNNLELKTFNKGVDLDRDLEHYRLDLNGIEILSNMMLLDTFSIGLPILLSSLSSFTSGSINNISGSINNITGSVNNISGSITELDSNFDILFEYSGSSGSFDASSIDQSYDHLIILGVGEINDVATDYALVGLDFNGIAGSASYPSVFGWHRSGSTFENGGIGQSGSEIFTDFGGAGILRCIPIGVTSGLSASTTGYPGIFMALIPDYSGSGGFYKNVLGFSGFLGRSGSSGSDLGAIGTFGGYWISSSSINQIRMFGVHLSSGSTRYNFTSDTKITIYGFG